MIEVRFHGRGGLGAVTAAELLARAAISEGKFAQAFPNFGPERRGAPVVAYLRISHKPIYLREKIGRPDVAVVLDPTLLGVVEPAEGLKPGGTLIISMSAQDVEKVDRYRNRFRVVLVDAARIATEVMGSPRVNAAMIGALIKAAKIVEVKTLPELLQDRFGRLWSKNMEVLERAFAEAVVFEQTGPREGNDLETAAASYEEILKRQAISCWEQLPIACDIDRPGSSSEFLTGNWRTNGRPVTDTGKCKKCDFCWIFCPDNAFSRNSEGYYDWDGRYCKGCGICAEECPAGAIVMEGEK